LLNAKYLAGIFLVVAAATIGWFILGATIVVRTDASDSAQRGALGGLWGSTLEQEAPRFTVARPNAQFFYLILFSYALFNEGYSGLSITIGAIVTLFVTMQLTGRIRWSERMSASA
jgi:hypothetical protein